MSETITHEINLVCEDDPEILFQVLQFLTTNQIDINEGNALSVGDIF